MILRSVHARRLPGIDDGFWLDGFGPGVNVIIGPNGAGKSSLCRAIRALLWAHPDPRISLSATWDEAGAPLVGAMEHGHIAWQRDGSPLDLQTPPEHLSPCYTVPIEELLPERGGDGVLARHIARQMAGGYDLAAVAAHPDIDLFPGNRIFRSESTRRITELERAQQALQSQEDSLAGLYRQLDAARAALARENLLKTACELARAREVLATAEEALTAFPPKLRNLGASDPFAFQAKTGEIGVARGQWSEAVSRAEEAEREIRRCGLAGGQAIPAGDLEAAEAEAREAVAAVGRLREARRRVGEAEARSETARAGWLKAADGIGRLFDRRTLDRVDEYLEAHALLCAREAGLEARKAGLRTDDEAPDPAKLVDGATHLALWLAVPAPVPAAGNPLLVGLFGIIALTGAALGLTGHPPAFIVTLLGAAGVALALRKRTPVDSGAAQREIYTREFGRLGVAAPARWEREAVEQRLRDLLDAAGPAWQARSAREIAAAADAELAALDGERRALEEEAAALAGDLGLTLEGRALTLSAWLRRLADCRQAELDLAAARRAAAAEEVELERRLAAVNSFVARVDAEAPALAADAEAARALVQSIAARDRELRAASSRAMRAREEAEHAEASVAAARAALAVFLAERQAADELEMGALLNHWQAWEKARKAADDARAEVERCERSLAAHAELLDLDCAAADALLAEAGAQAAELVKLQGNIADIEARVKQAKGGNALEEARAAEAADRERQEEKRQACLRAEAARFLLERAEQRTGAAASPVLARACALFEQFTRGAYTLRVSHGPDGAPCYRALEVDTNLGKAPEELSGGTRVQLLLAARLAFAESAEGTMKLPVFLDETLKHSDPERAAAIAQALHALAESGRQVFYLTNDSVEIDRLRAAAADGAVRVIDLGDARRQAAWSPCAPPEEPPAAVPPPDGRTPEEYHALLKAPRLNGFGDPATVDLFYLLSHDLPLLYRLRQAGITTVGRWRLLQARGRAQAGLVEPEAQQIDAWCEVAEEFLEAWRIGRGRPLTYEALKAADVSPVFLDRVWEIARELGCDARCLVAAMEKRDDRRLKGYRQHTIEEKLLPYLHDEGYLSDQEPLDADGILLEILNRTTIAPLTQAEVRSRVTEWCGRWVRG